MKVFPVQFDIHGLYKIEIQGLSRWALDDINLKYLHFRTENPSRPDLRVNVGPFSPDLKGCVNVDHQYHVRRNYIYFEERNRGLGFKVEIKGMEEDVTEINFQCNWANRLHFPWMLFHDAALHFYVLQPLLEYKLAQKGYFFLHAAGLHSPSRTLLICGRGASYKTTFCFRMLKRGYEFIGDDLILCSADRMLAFPTHSALFNFYRKNSLRSEDDLGFSNRVRLFFHLLRKPIDKIPAVSAGPPSDIFILHPRTDWAEPKAHALPQETGFRKLELNNRMERSSFISTNYWIGNFMNAYTYVFPENPFASHWSRCQSIQRALLSSSRFHSLEICNRWYEENLLALENSLEAL